MNADKQNSPAKYIIGFSVGIALTLLAILFYYRNYSLDKMARSSAEYQVEQRTSYP